MKNNKDVIFFGDGKQTRDWVHVEDIIKATEGKLIIEGDIPEMSI